MGNFVRDGQRTDAAGNTLQDFTSGQTSKDLKGLNTAISHMGILDQAATALGNNDVRQMNRFENFFGKQFGSSAQTNFDIVKNFAAGEVAKAVLPGGGGEAEREEIADAIRDSSSPDQLHSAIGQWRDLLAGKTQATRQQWDTGTNGTQGSFDQFLTPQTRQVVGIQSAPAGQYRSAADVKSAFQSGRLSRVEAKQILTNQFGMK